MQDRIAAAQKLLRYLADNDVPAVICGGYARDTICDKPIRDVDLYLSEQHYHFVGRLLFATYQPVRLEESDPQYVHQSIKVQGESTPHPQNDFGLPTDIVNLIGLNEHSTVSVEDVTSRFNLGICKAGIDLDGIHVTDDFRKDYREAHITLLRTDWGHEASLKQFIKLQAKYPWPLRVRIQEELF